MQAAGNQIVPRVECLQLNIPSLQWFEEGFWEITNFQILPNPSLSKIKQFNHGELTEEDEPQVRLDYLKHAFKSGQLHSWLNDTEFRNEILKIFRAEMLYRENNGISSTFISYGSVEIEGKKVPLFLIPIDVFRINPQEGFSWKIQGREIRINPGLLEPLDPASQQRLIKWYRSFDEEAHFKITSLFTEAKSFWSAIPGVKIYSEVLLTRIELAQFLTFKDAMKVAKQSEDYSLVKELMEKPAQGRLAMPWISGRSIPEEENPEKIWSPYPLDLHQRQAVLALSRGDNFVLSGSSGTGKTHTLVSILSQCVAKGKSALVVSRREHSLRKLQQRLNHCGLDPYVLRLYSEGVNKRKVLLSFEEALEFNPNINREPWLEAISNWNRSHQPKAKYDEFLLANSFGLSVYQALDLVYQGQKNGLIKIGNFEGKFPNYSKEEIQRTEKALSLILEISNKTEEGKLRVWSDVKSADWKEGLETLLKEKFLVAARSLSSFQSELEKLCKVWSWEISDLNFRRLGLLNNLINLLKNAPSMPALFLEIDDWGGLKKDILLAQAQMGEYLNAKKRVEKYFNQEIYQEKIPDLIKKWQKRNKGISLQRSFTENRVLSPLKKVSKSGEAPAVELIEGLLLDCHLVLQQNDTFVKNEALLRQYIGANEVLQEESGIQKRLDWAQSLVRCLTDLWGADPQNFSKVKAQIQSWLQGGNGSADALKELHRNEISVYWEQFSQEWKKISQVLQIDLMSGPEMSSPKSLLIKFNRWARELPSLKVWMKVQNQWATLQSLGFASLFDAWACGSVSLSNVRGVFWYNFAEKWLNNRFAQYPEWETFESGEIDKQSSWIQRGNKTYRMRLIDEIHRKRSFGKPCFGDFTSEESPVGFLKNQLASQLQQPNLSKSLRKLKPLQAALKPIFLMSPGAVAEHILPKEQFDVVILEDASEISPQLGLSMLARGRQAIILGDPHLPHSVDDFYNPFEGIEEDSILSLGIKKWKSIHLRTQYRMELERWTDFTNRYFTPLKNLSYPSLKQVANSEFRSKLGNASGSIQTLHAEKAFEKVKAELQEMPLTESLGVITLDDALANTMTELIETHALLTPNLIPLLDPRKPGGIWVRTLESSLGWSADRVIILFGVNDENAKTPDKLWEPYIRGNGAKYLALINSRANKKRHVLSFWNEESIQGIFGGKLGAAWADWLAGIGKPVQKNSLSRLGHLETAFVKYLDDLGWQVEAPYGNNHWALTCIVKSKINKDRIVAGILTEKGKPTGSYQVAERDLIDPAMFFHRGIPVLTLRSHDWFSDAEDAFGVLEQKLMQMDLGDSDVYDSLEQNWKNIKTPLFPNGITKSNVAKKDQEIGVPHSIYNIKMGTKDSFLRDREKVMVELQKLAEVEGPLRKDLAFDKFLHQWGLDANDRDYREHLQSLVKRMNLEKTTFGEYLWPTGASFSGEIRFRIPVKGASRPLEQVHPRELMEGVLKILQQNSIMEIEDLYQHILDLLGEMDASEMGRQVFEETLSILIEKGKISVNKSRCIFHFI